MIKQALFCKYKQYKSLIFDHLQMAAYLYSTFSELLAVLSTKAYLL